MPLITRQENGGPLTIEQLDENFLYLESISGGGSGGSGTSGTSGTSGVSGGGSASGDLQTTLNTGQYAEFENGDNSIALLGGDASERFVEWYLDNGQGKGSFGMWYPDFVELQGYTTSARGDFGIYDGKFVFSESNLLTNKGLSLKFQPATNYGDVLIPAPSVDGYGINGKTLVLSINGNYADSAGNINISGGGSGSGDLQSVLDAGYSATSAGFNIQTPSGDMSIFSNIGIQLSTAGKEGTKQINLFGPNGANYTATSTGVTIQGGQGSVIINGNNGGVILNGQGGGTTIDQGNFYLKGGNIFYFYDGSNTELGSIRPSNNGLGYWAPDSNGTQQRFINLTSSELRISSNNAPFTITNSYNGNHALLSVEGSFGQVAIGRTTDGLSDGVNISGRQGGVTINGNNGGVVINGQGINSQLGTTINGKLVIDNTNGTNITAPSSSADSGTNHEVRIIDNYIYWYVQGTGWLRILGSTF